MGFILFYFFTKGSVIVWNWGMFWALLQYTLVSTVFDLAFRKGWEEINDVIRDIKKNR